MNKVKNVCLILLAALLVAAGGLLPMGAARLQDEADTNVMQYADIEALQLKLEEEKQINLSQKLALIVKGSGSEVKHDMMQMQEGKVVETACAALQPYGEIYGVALGNSGAEYFPYMVWDENDPMSVNGYWHVYLPLAHSKNGAFNAILDDETGKILSLELLDPAMEISEKYFSEQLSMISTAYLNELGIIPNAEQVIENSESLDKGETQMGMLYRFADKQYGAYSVEIIVCGDGFRIVPV